MDDMQQIEDTMRENKDALERLDSSWENQELFYRAKQCLMMGHKVYCIFTADGKSYEAELVDAWRWSTQKVAVKLENGSIIRIPMSFVNCVKC